MRKSALVAFALVVAVLVALGLIVLLSASGARSIDVHKNAYHFFNRQVVYIGVGIVVAAVAAIVDYRKWREIPGAAWIFYGVVLVLMVLVLPQFIGHKVNGSYRWIPLGPVNLQPSELAKLATVVIVAVWMDRLGLGVEKFLKGTIVPYALIGAYAVLAQREPDYGSMMVIGFAGALVMFVAGARF